MTTKYLLGVSLAIAFSLQGELTTLPYYDFSHYYHTEVKKVFYPKTIAEVQEIVKTALIQNKKIAVAGAKMSQGGHTLPDDKDSILIQTKKLNRVDILFDTKTAIVGPGATWKDIQEAAHEKGLAVKVMQASNIFSIGGSLSTNIHGWDHIAGALVETVRSITIVDAFGEKRILTPDDELFSLVIGGYGLFGIIVEAEIELADDVVVERSGTSMPTENYSDYFTQKVVSNPSMVLHYGRLSLSPGQLFDTVMAVDYTLSSSEYVKPKKLPAEPPNGYWYERLSIHYLRKHPEMIKLKQNYDNVMFLKPKLMSRNEAMLPNIRFVYDCTQENADMLQEFFIPKHHLTPFLQGLKALIEKYDIHLFNATIRHVKQDQHTALPYAKRDVFAVVLFYTEALEGENIAKIEEFTRKAVDHALAWEGTFYLPYFRFPTIAQFQQAYPEYANVVQKKRLYDPQGIFSSQFFQYYFEAFPL